MTPLEIKDALRASLRSLIRQMNGWDHSGSIYSSELRDIRNTVYSLVTITDRLLDIVKVPPANNEHLPLNPSPFQPECRCKVERENNGSLTLYHCRYHKSIDFIHNELKALLVEISIGKSESELRKLIRNDIAFLDGYKTTSLTGRIGKAKDENVGR